jgi:hypothetical protein
MGIIFNRVTAVSTYLMELARFGLRESVGPLDQEVVFVLDGVGGFQFAPLLVRRALQREATAPGTIVVKWQFGVPGEIWTDLMWHRRNRVMAARLARGLLAFRREHSETMIHLLAFSGGAGIAVFALEALRGRHLIETLALMCPALSPQYNLGPALRTVQRGYALVSRRDTGILGLGTRIFGTTDRKFCAAAGSAGFRIPPDASGEDVQAYAKLREIRWSRSLKESGHHGGHTGWVSARLLQYHLLPILRGRPLLPVHEVLPA